MILKLELKNEREVEVLLNLISEAIKSKGLEGGAAKAGVHFEELILKAVEKANEEDNELKNKEIIN